MKMISKWHICTCAETQLRPTDTQLRPTDAQLRPTDAQLTPNRLQLGTQMAQGDDAVY